MERKAARKIADEIDKTLFITDFRNMVEIMHEDGTHLKINHACYNDLDDEWLAIFSEHHGVFVYHKEDLIWVKEWKQPEIKFWRKSE